VPKPRRYTSPTRKRGRLRNGGRLNREPGLTALLNYSTNHGYTGGVIPLLQVATDHGFSVGCKDGKGF
jgi:hypothetical protein